MKYTCKICGYVYDEANEPAKWSELPENWLCPVCGAGKILFEGEQAPSEVESKEASDSAADASEAGKESASTACDYIAQTLISSGVKCAFGMVGHSVLGMSDALRKFAERGEMRFVSIRHEGAGAFACSAYGKLMDKPALAVTIAGPGATNLMTGLYDAKLDSAPAIALTGQVDSRALGFYIFQEVDLTSVFKDLCVFQASLAVNSDFAGLARRAFEQARLKGGVSQLVLPDDVQVFKPEGCASNPAFSELSRKKIIPAYADIEAACKFINSAKKPLILAGAGARDSADLICKFAEKLRRPLATTYRAKGLVGDGFKYACGVAGLSGTEVSAKMLADCDCIVAFGCGLSRHTSLPKGKTIVQIDRDPAAFGRRRRAYCEVLGDCGLTLERLLECDFKDFGDSAQEIAEAWEAWRQSKRKLAEASPLNSAAALEILSDKIESDAIISVDVGELAYSFGKYFEAKNQTVLLSFYLGSIGVGLPSAIGAWCAANEEGSRHFKMKVYAYVGDGGLGQYLAEWTTVAKYNMDIVCIVENNSELAKISKEQRNAKMDIWETNLRNPSFAEYARSCGTKAARVETREQLIEALKNIPEGEPYLIEMLTAK